MLEAKAAGATNAINRREFLYYLWGVSIAVLAAGTCGASLVWLAAGAKLRSGEQYGLYTFLPAQLPPPAADSIPRLVAAGRFWLSSTDHGMAALQPFCTRCGCRYKWQPNGAPGHEFPHFICPCCVSQFTNGGVCIAGAMRNLDQFGVIVMTLNGTRYTPASGGPIDSHGATQIIVDIRRSILGKSRSTFTLLQ